MIKPKLITLIAMLTFSVYAPLAYAVENWTISISGVIASGRDGLGLFGERKQLDGLMFTESITTSIDPKDWENHVQSNNLNSFWVPTDTPFKVQITVGDKSISFIELANDGAQQIGIGTPNNGFDNIFCSLSRNDWSTQRTINATISAWSYAPFISSLDFSQVIQNPQVSLSNFASFSLNERVDTNQGYMTETTNFFGQNGGNLTLNISSVPEPATYSMLLLGLVLITTISLRRRQ